MEQKLFIPLILATNRKGRVSEQIAKLLFQKMETHPEIETHFFDVRDFNFPKDDYGQAIKDQFPEYRDAIIKADGILIVSPEYNHGFPGTLKTLLDTLLKEYNHKAAGIVGVSAGPWGGTRMIESLLPVMREFGLVTISKSVNVARAGNVFDEQGNLTDDAMQERIDSFLQELIWMARTLRWGRTHLSKE